VIKPLEEDSRTEVKLLIDASARACSRNSRARASARRRHQLAPMLQCATRYRHHDSRPSTSISTRSPDAEFEAAHKAQFGFVYENKTDHHRGHR
jgi:5-oxoprolinase (ATP-hydrolysing)